MKNCYFYCIIDPTANTVLGGGEQTANNIIDNIKACDYNVKIITPRSEFIHPDNADLLVYHDIFNDPNGSNWFKGIQYAKLLNTEKPFLISECAYTACTIMPYGIERENIPNRMPNLAHLSRHFFLKATRTILASPLHKETVESFINSDLRRCHLYLREVDTNHFKPDNIERTIEYLHVGVLNYEKGIDLIVDKYHDKGLTIAGFGSLPKYIGLANWIGRVDYKDLPDLYNQAKNFIHLPRWKESFSRTTCEASLCGCNIIGNENIGALSWKKDLSNPHTYSDSHNSFINMIHDVETEYHII